MRFYVKDGEHTLYLDFSKEVRKVIEAYLEKSNNTNNVADQSGTDLNAKTLEGKPLSFFCSKEYADAINAFSSKLNTSFQLHKSNTEIHFTQEDISITESQVSNLNKYTREEIDSKESNLQNQIASNSTEISNNQALINDHISDSTTHFTQEEIIISENQVNNLVSDLASKSDVGHTHDDRYYTETEINTKTSNLQNQIDANSTTINNHKNDATIHFKQSDISIEESQVNNLVSDLSNKADVSHTHDDRYYTETEIDEKLSNKSDTTHTHDDRYYTENEIDNKLSSKADQSEIDTLSATVDTINNEYAKKESIRTHNSNIPSTAKFPFSDEYYATMDEVAQKVGDIIGDTGTGSSDGTVKLTADDTNPNFLISKLDTDYFEAVNNDYATLKSNVLDKYTQSEVDTKLAQKSDTGHNHDDRYYTESEIDNKLSDKASLSQGNTFTGEHIVPSIRMRGNNIRLDMQSYNRSDKEVRMYFYNDNELRLYPADINGGDIHNDFHISLFVNGSYKKVWDESNDGSGSGLDADKLDNLEASQFVRNDTTHERLPSHYFHKYYSISGGVGTHYIHLGNTTQGNNTSKTVIRTYLNNGIKNTIIIEPNKVTLEPNLYIGSKKVWHSGDGKVIKTVSSLPSASSNTGGIVYYNGKMYYSNGTAWVQM